MKTREVKLGARVAALVLATAWGSAVAQGDDVTARLDALEQKLSSQPSVTLGRNGLSVETADKDFRLRLRGYAQVDGRFFADSSDAGTDQFLIRRARVIVEGRVTEWVSYRIMPEFGGSGFSLQDAHIDLALHPAVTLRAGKFKAPVSLERLQSATNIKLVERAYPSSLAPNRDIGVQLQGAVLGGTLDYALGVFNGTPDGGSVNGDTDDKKDVVGRLFAHPFKNTDVAALQGLGIGIAASHGDRQGDLSNTALAGVRTPGQSSFFSYLSSTNLADAVVADGSVTRIAPQAYYYVGPLGILGEYIQSSTDVKKGEDEETLDHKAWFATVSWLLTGEKASFGGVTPRNPFNPSSGGWGAWEVVGRVSAFEADSKTFPTFANPSRSAQKAESWAVGLNGYLTSNLRVALTYEETSFDGGAANGADREKEQVAFARLQVGF
jgi:phosphate-selective porin OprO/OprP